LKGKHLWVSFGFSPGKKGEKFFKKISPRINPGGKFFPQKNNLLFFLFFFPEGGKPLLQVYSHYKSGDKASLVETPWGYLRDDRLL
jgi:hypothetical protein